MCVCPDQSGNPHSSRSAALRFVMVDIDEIDDEGQPLRSERYVRDGPSLMDRVRPLFTCWQYCHMSLAIWITLVIFSTICILGVLVLRGNSSASTSAYPACGRLYTWVLFWVIITAINTVWYAIEEGFRVPAVELDPDAPNGVRETPLAQQNSMAFIYVRVFRLTVHFILTLVFFIVGYDIFKNSKCAGHTDLWLYFKVFWWCVASTAQPTRVLMRCHVDPTLIRCLCLPLLFARVCQVPRDRLRSDGAPHPLRRLRRLLCTLVGVTRECAPKRRRRSLSGHMQRPPSVICRNPDCVTDKLASCIHNGSTASICC
jgi:hypothetical protein